MLLACNVPDTNHQTALPYSEQHRPQFHFTPDKGWMNDPNGLVYFQGSYHLFYQYYPDSTIWGPMHWGHAVSPDLVHWDQLPIALYPDSLGYIFSGSVVADIGNTSGFGKNQIPPLVAVFTHHDMVGEKAGKQDIEVQSIAYSSDKGLAWIKYQGNPVIANPGLRNFRDPNVFRYEREASWIMLLAAGDHLAFYKSKDLLTWEKCGEFGQGHGAHGGVWECPDLFPFVAPDGTETWVLIQNIDRGAVNGGSGTQYFVGQFDGNTFINSNPPDTTLWFDYGADNYAGVTWFGARDGRRVFIGWMSQWFDYAHSVPTYPWRGAMTIPRELAIRPTERGIRLFQRPVVELISLRQDTIAVEEQTISDRYRIRENGVCHELQLTFDLTRTSAVQCGFVLSNELGEEVYVGINRIDHTIFIDRTNSGKDDFSDQFARKHEAPYRSGTTLRLHAFIDVSSVEVFVDNGEIAMTEIFFPNSDFTRTDLFSQGGLAQLSGGYLYGLKRIWQ
jgi:fructan beta-fructosidase